MCELCSFLAQPSTEGYIAVILPKFEESKSVTEGLLTREQYEEVLTKRNQQEEPCWDQLALWSCWLTAESALKNNYFKQVETSMASWLCATYISKNILRKFEGMKTCLLDPEKSWISLECILLDHYSWYIMSVSWVLFSV